METVEIDIRGVPTRQVRVSRPSSQGGETAGIQRIGLGNSNAIIIGDADVYEGEYRVTPSREKQVLSTAGRALAQNVVVEPIPKNYGLITYNGFELTVS